MSAVESVLRDFSRRAALALAFAIVFTVSYALPGAQTAAKKALTVDDYTKWRSISGQQISDDGVWVAYVLQFTNVPTAEAKPELHLLNLETNQDVTVANATGGTFSADSRWIAYQIDPTGGRGGRGRGRAGGDASAEQTPQPGRGGANAAPAEPRRAELRNLATGEVKSWQDVQSFTFSPSSTHLVLRRRPAEAAGGGGRGNAGGGGQAQGGAAANTPPAPRGVDVVLHNLATGRDLLLGSVADISFNKDGSLLAYTVDASVKDSNGLFVIELADGQTHPFDNDAKTYNRLTWNEDGTALAGLKGVDVEKMRERSNVLLVFRDVPGAVNAAALPTPTVLDPPKAGGFPEGWVASDRAALEWSADGQRVFFGMKQQVPAPETARRDTDEAADVDVWNTLDERIQSLQMRQAEADRNRTYRQAFDTTSGAYVRLADETMRDLDVAPEGKWAVGRDVRGYVHDFNRPAADLYRVDTGTGQRTLMLKDQLTGSHLLGFSADGRYFLYWADEKIHAYDLGAGASKALAPNVKFTNMEFDRPGPKPAYGITGYTPDGKAAIVEHRYDLWVVPFDGSAARNLTNGAGAKDEVRFRYVRTERDEEESPGPAPGGRGGRGGSGPQKIDLTKPLTLSAYGEYTKKAGFYELANGRLTPLVYEDASFSNPARAAKAERLLFTRQTFVEFPDLRVSGTDFKDAKKITDANPQQAEFAWGRRVLFDFQNRDGVRLQGILALPDDYQPGQKRPMIVTFYEKNSQNMNRYSAPSYLTGMGSSPMEAVSRGYITMLPDIHFRTGSSHTDMLECVEAAVKKVIEMGYADPARIGLNGHSYGGEGAAFIGVRSKMFAAVAMGAGVTDLTSDFNQSWGWSYQIDGGSGANGHDYYLFGQGRWGFAPWDNPEVYRFESAITHVKDALPPFLIMHGTADPTVSFSEGMNFYNALRYYGKRAVMLAYPGEGHGLRGWANRKDLTIRFFQFFDHYLKGAPAPKWLSEGVPYIQKDQNRDPGASASGTPPR